MEGEGIFKSLFKVVKAALEGRGLECVCITGVSPIVVYDMTSGFSLAEVGKSGEVVCGLRREKLAALTAVATKQQQAQTKLVPRNAACQIRREVAVALLQRGCGGL